jgi:hypothetical protein
MARHPRARRAALDLLLNLALALVAELVVRVTGWSRLPVLLVVLTTGHLVHAVVRGWAAGERIAARPAARSGQV